MARLSVYLPPFSPDYSGVASAFFDLGALSVLHDASGCTGTYTGYDEPRWYGSHYPAYCSGLREIDAIMGNDQKLIDRVVAAENDIKADIITIIGSPVPMVVGCDAKGIASEIEAITGVPSFGFDTTGTAYYDKGIAMAARALLERFSAPCQKEKGSVNILGLDAIDFPLQETRDGIVKAAEAAGAKVNATFPASTSVEQLRMMARAELDIVVSASGIEMAETLKRKYGIPYIICLPYGDTGEKRFRIKIHNFISDIKDDDNQAEQGTIRALVLGEAVSSMAIRDELQQGYGIKSTAVSVFTQYKALEKMGCMTLPDEMTIRDVLNGGWDIIIADPLFRKLLDSSDSCFIDNPTYSISSKLYLDKSIDLTGKRLNEAFGKEIDSIMNRRS